MHVIIWAIYEYFIFRKLKIFNLLTEQEFNGFRGRGRGLGKHWGEASSIYRVVMS